MIVLDTHVLIWYRQGMKRLGPRTLALLDRELQRGVLAVSSITFYETENAMRSRTIDISLSLSRWRQEILSGGVLEFPVTGEIAVSATLVPHPIRDPFDRIIVATAEIHDAVLVTADTAILDTKLGVRREDATR